MFVSMILYNTFVLMLIFVLVLMSVTFESFACIIYFVFPYSQNTSYQKTIKSRTRYASIIAVFCNSMLRVNQYDKKVRTFDYFFV